MHISMKTVSLTINISHATTGTVVSYRHRMHFYFWRGSKTLKTRLPSKTSCLEILPWQRIGMSC